MEITERIIYLLHGYVHRELTDGEQEELSRWAGQHPSFQRLLVEVSDEHSLTEALQAFDQVYAGDSVASIARMEGRIAAGIGIGDTEAVPLESVEVPRRFHRLRNWLPYVAAVLIAAIAVTYFFFEEPATQAPQLVVNLAVEDIAPGGSRAQLTLADGRTIELSDAQSGIVVSNDITYSDGTIVDGVSATGGKPTGEAVPLVLATPKGGTYHLTLADGSKVWLNAASTLKYPSRFNDNERGVELEGEAYFEVAEDAGRPFKVRSSGQEVEVLGTEFNVSAYPDEEGTKTTLVKGSVRLSLSEQESSPAKNVILKPGKQAWVTGSDIRVETVNTDMYTAWKDGFFYFDRLPTRAALAQLARWYNLELIYEGELTKVNMFAYIERDKPLSAVLKSLEASGLKFKVVQKDEQKQLVVLGESESLSN